MKNGYTEQEHRWRKSAMQPQKLHRHLRHLFIWLAVLAVCCIYAVAAAKWDWAVIITLHSIAPVLCIYLTRRMIADAENENRDI